MCFVSEPLATRSTVIHCDPRSLVRLRHQRRRQVRSRQKQASCWWCSCASDALGLCHVHPALCPQPQLTIVWPLAQNHSILGHLGVIKSTDEHSFYCTSAGGGGCALEIWLWTLRVQSWPILALSGILHANPKSWNIFFCPQRP